MSDPAPLPGNLARNMAALMSAARRGELEPVPLPYPVKTDIYADKRTELQKRLDEIWERSGAWTEEQRAWRARGRD